MEKTFFSDFFTKKMNFLRLIPHIIRKNLITSIVMPYTMVSKERVLNLYRLACMVEKEGIKGDIVECGVANGGTAAVLSHIATTKGSNRTVWLFDSFQGMPPTSPLDSEEAKQWVGQTLGSKDKVLEVLKKVGADLTKVKIIEGMFEETFPKVGIPKIALLNIDADWYDSVKLCLEKFYDSVVGGGVVSIDDYGHWEGCRRAVDELFAERGLKYKLNRVDYTARWFRKE